MANSKIYKNIIEYSKQNHLSTLFSKDIVSKYFSKLNNVIFYKCRHCNYGIYYQFYHCITIENYLKKENPSYFKEIDF